MARSRLDKKALLERLERIKFTRPERTEQDRFENVNLAASLLLLADVGQEKLLDWAQSTAEHLLGHVPEPDDADLGEE
jgi:DNA-binding TFAR19-related protein (PDSD5 family)